jgi:threonine/homoserine efflux transporter RhtA
MLRLLMPLVGALFLLVAAFWVYRSVVARSGDQPLDVQLRLISAGVAIATGVTLIVEPFSGYLSLETAQFLLAVGLALLGLIGLVPAYRGALDPDERVIEVTVNLALIGLALLTLLSLERDTSPVELLGRLAILAGVALVVYAVVLGRRPAQSLPGTAPASVEPPSDAVAFTEAGVTEVDAPSKSTTGSGDA